jgi:quercetin dioxygenase-like cupin family protein
MLISESKIAERHRNERGTSMASQSPFLATHPLQGDQLCFNLETLTSELRADLGEADRRGVALIKEDGLNVVLTVLREGARIGGRDTPGACAIQVVDGRVRVQSPGPVVELEPGQLAAFHASVGQEVVALEEAALLVTVALDPPRHQR